MCLQWCHVHAWLIDNDLPCIGCDRGEAQRLPVAWSCASCVHHVARDGQTALCALTRETLPLIGRCCHWQAERTAAAQLSIGDADVAPWLSGTVIAVFAASPSAPSVTLDACRVVVELGALSVPLVYGVSAPDWDAALGWDMAGPADWDTPLDDARQRAITDVLAALEQDALALSQALAQLIATLGGAGAVALPESWRALLQQILDLSRELYGGDVAIVAQLDAWETDACISH